MFRIGDLARDNKGAVFNLLFSFLVIVVGPYYIHAIELVKAYEQTNALIAFLLLVFIIAEPFALYFKINSIYAAEHVKRDFTIRYVLLWVAHIFITIMTVTVMAFAMPDPIKWLNIPFFWIVGIKEFLFLFFLLNRQVSDEPDKKGNAPQPLKKVSERSVFLSDVILSVFAFLVYGITWQSVGASGFLGGMMNDLADSILFRLFTYLFMFTLIYYPIRLGHFIEEWLTNRSKQQKRNYYLSLLLTMTACIGPLFRGPGLPPADEMNLKDGAGKTPLISGVEYEPLPYLRALIENGADINARDTSGYTALHYAAKGGRTEAVKLLLELGADPNKQANDGGTALALTAGFSHVEALKLLLQYHADPNLAYTDGDTPLNIAAEQGLSPECVEWLLKYKADADHQDDNGYNAIMRFSHYHNISDAKSERILQLLIDHTDPQQRDNKGRTMVWHALRFNGWPYTDVAKALMRAGVAWDSTDIINKDGWNLLTETYVQEKSDTSAQ